MKRLATCALALASLLGVAHGKEEILGATPAMGWNSWNRFHCDISEDLIKQTADALVETGLRDLGYVYLNLDDCWQDFERDANGRVQAAKEFPSGMKALGEYIHSKGLKFGLYSSGGTKTCAGRAGSLRFEKIDAETYAEWELDYLKYDNCNNEDIPPFVRMKTMSDALRATGRDIYFSLCEWGLDLPHLWAPAIAQSWRSTADIFNDWETVIHNFWWQEPFLIHNKPGSWNDPDIMEVGNGVLTFVQQKSHFSLWAVSKSPLLIGCDVTNMDNETRAVLMNKEVIAINQDPLGLPALRKGDPIPGCGAAVHVFAGPLQNGDVVVAAFNHIPGNFCGDSGAQIFWEQIGLPASAKVAVRDLWLHEDMGTFTEKYVIPGDQIEGFSTTVLRLSPVDGSKHSLMKDYEQWA